MSGKMYIPIIHELVCAFLDVSGAENRMTAIPSFTTGDVSIFRQALSKDGAAKITKDLRRHGMLPESVEFLSPGQAGYENGIGMMSAEERMAASEKGYENGLGAMSAKERKAAGEKGYENGIGMMSAKERMAAGEKGYENGIGMMSARRGWRRVKRDTRMGSELCRPRRGARSQQSELNPILTSGLLISQKSRLSLPTKGERQDRNLVMQVKEFWQIG
jgi:hypothetical protein